ncbi:MAG: alpha/beta fold hydrolase [Acetobacteraceae bacterium]|nr:alpha/beta fold hydrolase [Acetobacteraceae bacterium]
MAATPLLVRDIGSFHVGGRIAALTGLPLRERLSSSGGPVHPIDPNGDIVAGQMYVQYVQLAEPKAPAPLLMWHGGGMTGANWETTPDGRPGWQMFFLRAGFDTYVSDAVERGRAGWAPFPQIYPEAPYFRTAKEAWEETFRFGPPGSWHPDPAQRRPHDGLRFPVGCFEAFLAQSVPRWGCNNDLTQRAYDALLQRMPSGAIVLTHSQGGNFGLTAALNAPERVRAVVSLDPSGAPDPEARDAGLLRDVPHLFVWGDFLDRHRFWINTRPGVQRWRDALSDAGCDVTWLDLPAAGIRGNSHALMADDNSDAIAALVLQWLAERHLAGAA